MRSSYFDGEVLQLIGWKFLAWLLTAVTFGIAYPWAVCMVQRWETKHTVIESNRLKFDGKGIQLLGVWILLAILPLALLAVALLFARAAIQASTPQVIVLLIVCGVIVAACWSYFVQIQIKKWITKHTQFQDPVRIIDAPETSQPQRVDAPAYAAAAPAQTVHLSDDSILDTPLFLVGAAVLSAVGVGAFIFTAHIVPGLVVAAIGLGLLIVFYVHQ